ncbi:Asp-tRNA(Asn)/Glu-tRNA(Gln) amidotransferase subunit GatC [Candidatus Saccharibacteria bacterium]|nr:Asp-tRNA(Asn)/Glu-tRNA(Gln) amidotransferase subunit GatC [Candidatus Saccharibacteria bacterium]
MSKLSREDVLKLAKLSRLKLSDDEVQKFQNELSEILDYVEKLNAVDTSGLQPSYQVTGLTNVMRSDELIEYGATPDELLKNAPAVSEHQFKVKRVL